MKKWMALLLGCLLCACAVGAMAEETETVNPQCCCVTISILPAECKRGRNASFSFAHASGIRCAGNRTVSVINYSCTNAHKRPKEQLI